MKMKPFIGALLGVLFAGPSMRAAEPLSTWHMRVSPYGTTNSWRGLVFANGKFVACGSRGLIAVSTDGTSWSPHAVSTSSSVYSVAFGGGIFVATGQSGLVATSADGVSWQIRDPNSNAHLYHVSYNNSQFVAVSDGGVILSSPDGVTWTPHNTNFTNKWRASAFGNGTYVVVGYRTESPFSYTRSGASPTLSNWDIRDTGGSLYLSGLTFGSGKFVACGYGGLIQSSADGVNWTAPATPSTAWLNAASYADNIFVAAGESGSIVSSTDGVNWTNRHSQLGMTLHSLAFGNNTWVVVGNNSVILQSDPVSGSMPSERPVLSEAAKASDVFSFKFSGTIGQTYAIQASTDLTNWGTLSNITCTASPMPCTIGGQSMAQRFYRLVK